MIAEAFLWWWFETVDPAGMAGLGTITAARSGPFHTLTLCEARADLLESRTAPRGPIVIRNHDGSACFPATRRMEDR